MDIYLYGGESNPADIKLRVGNVPNEQATTTEQGYRDNYGRYAVYDRNPKSWVTDYFVDEPDN